MADTAARVILHPTSTALIEDLFDRLRALEGEVAELRARVDKPHTPMDQIENRRRLISAIDATIAGDKKALRMFYASGGWTPPKEFL